MFIICQLTHQYPPRQILSFPDWKAEPGEKCLLMGTSGSGKTTLLHILAGILRPTQGNVVVAGTNLNQLKGKQLDHFRGQYIGLVLQKPHLLDTLSVLDNLRLTQYLAGLPPDTSRIREVLYRLQLADKQQALPSTLSQGEAQRASIARAVLNRPRLILADEPTSSLDDENCGYVLDLLEQQASGCHATLLVATHDSRVKARFPKPYYLTRPTNVLP